jgi:hypothetical protein
VDAGKVELWSWFDLPDDSRSRELSAAAWDEAARVLWAVQDAHARIVALVPDQDLRTWSLGATIPLLVDGPLDLEGLVVTPDGFLVSSEIGPRIVEVDRSGRYRRDIPVPPRFRDARPNKSLEALSASPSARYLFTTTEASLPKDGALASASTGMRLRIVRIDRSSMEEVSEHLYTTDPLPYAGGELGISDLAALSDDTLLVLERGYSRERGNTGRIYQTSLHPSASSLGVDQLAADQPSLTKTLRIDIGKLEAPGMPKPKQAQASPILDNYEGLALGPRLRDGRSSLIVVSDDNAHADQVARVLVLAVGRTQ